MTNGHTLLEISVVLSLLGLLAAVAAGSARRHVDHLAVRAAREEVVALVQRARAEARVHGASRVRLVSGGGVELRVPGDSLVAAFDPASRAIHLRVEGARSEADLHFGPLGIGRAASATVSLERGGMDATLVVSSHGRVRRR